MRGEDWERDLERWLEPFLALLPRPEQRRWAPAYLKGLLLPGERKSVEPMARRVAPGDVQQLHHFVAASPWATAPLEKELARCADRLVGGSDAVLVIDDMALPKGGLMLAGTSAAWATSLSSATRLNCWRAGLSPSAVRGTGRPDRRPTSHSHCTLSDKLAWPRRLMLPRPSRADAAFPTMIGASRRSMGCRRATHERWNGGAVIVAEAAQPHGQAGRQR